MSLFFKFDVPDHYIPEVHCYPVLSGIEEETGEIYWEYPEFPEKEMQEKQTEKQKKRIYGLYAY